MGKVLTAFLVMALSGCGGAPAFAMVKHHAPIAHSVAPVAPPSPDAMVAAQLVCAPRAKWEERAGVERVRVYDAALSQAWLAAWNNREPKTNVKADKVMTIAIDGGYLLGFVTGDAACFMPTPVAKALFDKSMADVAGAGA